MGVSEQPTVPGQIIRLLCGHVGEASSAQGLEHAITDDIRPQVGGAAGRPPKRKIVPQEVMPEYEGPRLSGGQELCRLFATP
eukprot:5890895-Heterocapsa_arctica.AAC.1